MPDKSLPSTPKEVRALVERHKGAVKRLRDMRETARSPATFLKESGIELGGVAGAAVIDELAAPIPVGTDGELPWSFPAGVALTAGGLGMGSNAVALVGRGMYIPAAYGLLRGGVRRIKARFAKK